MQTEIKFLNGNTSTFSYESREETDESIILHSNDPQKGDCVHYITKSEIEEETLNDTPENQEVSA